MPSTKEVGVLAACDQPLSSAYDLAMLDLDGVVYIGEHAVAGAPEHLAEVRATGMHCAFITNNASRSPVAVADHLRDLGVSAADAEVVTSAQAAAAVLARELPPAAQVAVLGSPALAAEVEGVGLRPVAVDEPEAHGVVSGYGPDVLWRELMRAAVRIRDGLWWVATNADLTIPTPFGDAPGHGVLVDTLSRFSGVRPVVAGKPERPLLDETVRRTGARRPLMVGDRLDTDILGAGRAGIDSLLVLTGVTGLTELASARPDHRPTYLSGNLGGLLEPHVVPSAAADGVHCGGWTARCEHGRMEVSGGGSLDDWWRAVVTAAWDDLDRTGTPCQVDGLRPGSLAP